MNTHEIYFKSFFCMSSMWTRASPTRVWLWYSTASIEQIVSSTRFSLLASRALLNISSWYHSYFSLNLKHATRTLFILFFVISLLNIYFISIISLVVNLKATLRARTHQPLIRNSAFKKRRCWMVTELFKKIGHDAFDVECTEYCTTIDMQDQ